MKNVKHILFAAALGSPSIASANAFNINEHDARVTGRGDAAAASDTSPSAMVFNPGGIPIADGTNYQLGGSLIFANGAYTLEGTNDKVSTDSPPALVPSVYITTRINDLIAVGVGMHFPFGLAISWPDQHPQSDVIQDQALRTYFITPVVGFNLDKQVPGLSIGGGPDLVPATVELHQALIFGDTRGTAVLGGDAFGVGGRVGVMYRPPMAKQLKVGAMWRSSVKLDFSGKGDFDIADPYRAQLPPDGDISTSITLPQSVSGGVAYDPIPNLEVELNAVWMDWSKFNELRIELPAGAETVAPERYHDTWTYRLGAEYGLPQYKAAVRAGFIYDPSPIPPETLTAQLPDINRKNITLGGSKYFEGGYAMHLGVLWVTPGSRETSMTMYMPVYKATYDVQAFVANLSIEGHLGK